MNVEEKLRMMGVTLPTPPARKGVYVPVKQAGNVLYVSGHGPAIEGMPEFLGKVGAELTVEEGQQAARQCVMNILAQLDAFLHGLEKVKNVVKLLGFVASAPDFHNQPMVINGGSQFLVDIFEERGWHARSAIGVNELPGNIPVEIEAIFEI